MVMFNFILRDIKLSLLLLINFICLGIVFFYSDSLTAKKIIKAEHGNINFDNRSPDPALSRIKEFNMDRKSEPKNVSVSFEMKALDDYYDNVFQTADDPLTIRLELSHPNVLSLIVGNDKAAVNIYKITDKFELNVWHKMEVNLNEDKAAEVILDGQKMLSFTDKSISYDISDIAVGTGYNKLRGFQGEIKNFHIRYERYQRVFIFELIIFLTNILLVITVLVIAYKLLAASYGTSLQTGTPMASEVLFIPGIAIVIVLAGYIAGLILHRTSNWHTFLLLGFAAPFFQYFYSKVFNSGLPSNLAKLVRILATFSFFAAVAFLVFNSVHVLTQAMPMLVVLCIGITILYTLTFSGYLPVSLIDEKKRLFFTLTLITFSLVSWFAMLDLPNWRQFSKSLTERPVVTSIFFFFFTGIVHRYLFKVTDAPLPTAFSVISTRLSQLITLLLVTSALVIFFLMSFRYDTFFAGTSEGHWEYFIGPVRNVKNGSWLLWDTPSQYGFLNILAASLLPFKSPWESFYVLQGILLFLASVMIFRIYLANRTLKSSIFFGFLVTFSSLFFADPDLIGPYLFPSSSVIRFFWCYALLFFLLQAYIWSRVSLKKMVSLGTILWLSGFLWSSESAIYSSVTFFPAIFTAILQEYYEKFKNSKKTGSLLKHIFLYMSVPFLSFVVLICAITAYYRLRLSHFPDFYVFVEHGFAYAGGFGSVFLNPSGPVWVPFLLFCAILIVTVRLALKDPYSRYLVPLVGACGCLWGISSYFIGRAVPNNVTAILPILGFIAIIASDSAEADAPDPSQVFLKAVTVPLFTLILMTSFGNMEFVDRLRNFQSLTVDVSQKVRSAGPDLQELMEKANIRNTDPVVFYGSAAAVPRWKIGNQFVLSDKTWMPNPLQLIEEPIGERRRRTYIRRFMDRYKGGGYFIQAKGEAEDRAANWLSIIDKTHRPVRVFENDKWKIVYFEHR